jgi:hypothetical protein
LQHPIFPLPLTGLTSEDGQIPHNNILVYMELNGTGSKLSGSVAPSRMESAKEYLLKYPDLSP